MAGSTVTCGLPEATWDHGRLTPAERRARQAIKPPAVQNLSRFVPSPCSASAPPACSYATMQPRTQALLRAALAVLLTSAGLGVRAGAQDPRSGLDPITSAVMGHPITTS